MEIPEFVFVNGGTKSDWIKVHDEYSGDIPDHLIAITKETWWRNNWTIRIGIKQIRGDVDSKLLSKKKPKSKDTSISCLSRITRLSRDTIKHPGRFYWVSAALFEIESLIREKNSLSIERSSKDKSLIANLRRNLDNQRSQTAKLYIENQELIEKLETQKKINENYRLELERAMKVGKTFDFLPNLSTDKRSQ
jgi:hypothetical protein